MTKKLLYAHVLLDRSGSMETIRAQTIDAFNEYVSGLTKDADLDAAVSLSTFHCDANNDLLIERVIDGQPAAELPKLTRDTYTPGGGTPLNDAIGKTVELMEKQWHRPGEAIALVILTDGQENASRELKTDAVKALLKRVQEEKHWLVIYLGANQDAFAEGNLRGTILANTMNFVPSSIKTSLAAAARATSSYAGGYAKAASTGDWSGAIMDSAFTEEEREQSNTPT